MSELIKRLRLLQAWYLPAGPEPEEAMPSKYRAFKEAADRIVELERDLAAANAALRLATADVDAVDKLTEELAAANARAEQNEKDAERWKQVMKLFNLGAYSHGSVVNRELLEGRVNRGRRMVSIVFPKGAASEALAGGYTEDGFIAAIDAAIAAKEKP